MRRPWIGRYRLFVIMKRLALYITMLLVMLWNSPGIIRCKSNANNKHKTQQTIFSRNQALIQPRPGNSHWAGGGGGIF